jgi:hypothetical protein
MTGTGFRHQVEEFQGNFSVLRTQCLVVRTMKASSRDKSFEYPDCFFLLWAIVKMQ